MRATNNLRGINNSYTLSKSPQPRRRDSKSIHKVSNNIFQGPHKQKFESLRRNKLRDLNLAHLKINDDQMIQISKLLKKASRLVSINLKGNQLTYQGVKSLIEGIQKLKVKTIDISNNKIPLRGLATFFAFAKKNSALKFIKAKRNKFKSGKKDKIINDFKSYGVIIDY